MRRFLLIYVLAIWPSGVFAQSWTAPRTWVAGELVTAALLNTHVKDNLTVLRAGGFAVTSQAIGDLLCASSTTQFARLADVAAGQVLASGGVGACPAYTSAPTIAGTNFTSIPAAQLTGTIADARLSTNVPLLNANNNFSVTQYIGDTANTFMTLGQTVNQGAADNEAWAGKSSDVAHGITSETELDTFGTMSKASATLGGMKFNGYLETGQSWGGVVLQGALSDAADATKSSAGYGVVRVNALTRSGTTVTAVAADGNLFSIDTNGSTKFIVDADGDLWAGGIITSSSVGTAALRTATASVAGNTATNVTMQDYTFFPNVERDDCTYTAVGFATHDADATNDTVGRFANLDSCSAGTWDIRYRYVTASDNPDLWILKNDVTGKVIAVWQAEDPAVEPPLSAAGHTAVQIEVPSIADVKAMYTDLEPTLRQQARVDFLTYLVQRGWATEGQTVAEAIDQIPARYRRAARLWAARFIARAAGVDPAELILETMQVVNGAIAPKPSYAMVVEAHRTARASRIVANRSQAIERLGDNWTPVVPVAALTGVGP